MCCVHEAIAHRVRHGRVDDDAVPARLSWLVITVELIPQRSSMTSSKSRRSLADKGCGPKSSRMRTLALASRRMMTGKVPSARACASSSKSRVARRYKTTKPSRQAFSLLDEDLSLVDTTTQKGGRPRHLH